jgi:hypothetical protein
VPCSLIPSASARQFFLSRDLPPWTKVTHEPITGKTGWNGAEIKFGKICAPKEGVTLFGASYWQRVGCK